VTWLGRLCHDVLGPLGAPDGGHTRHGRAWALLRTLGLARRSSHLQDAQPICSTWVRLGRTVVTWKNVGVSHLLHTRQLSHLRALLYKLGNVEREVLHRLIYLNVMLPSCGRPDAVVILLKPAQQTHP
jgi:hypothetical protein